MLLSVASTIVSLIAGSLLGSLSVRLRRRRRDVPLILTVALVGSFPAFWVGMVLIAIFGVNLGILPIYGAYSMWSGYTGIRQVLDVAAHMILPVITMSMGSLMIFFTTMRAGLLSVLGEDYIKLADARGLPRRRILFFYQWRNAVIPVFTVLMLHLGFIMSGSIIIEAVFSYPGLGTVLYQAVLARDYPLMQYSFLLIAFTVIIANLIADLCYPILDPRIRKA
jgi:peptide/nickel transport system permease protein